MYTIGMEEEFFVFDAKTRRAVQRVDKNFFKSARERLGDRVMTEMLQSQIEVATPPCATAAEARAHLANYRGALGQAARDHGLGIAAMGTFPLAFWPEQQMTPKAATAKSWTTCRWSATATCCAACTCMSQVPDLDTRINLIMRLTPYLPLLLALSTSSPFWQGHLTGLVGYRLAAYDELPRTGLPELFRTNEDYNEFVDALVGANIIPDASYIWWALRPSLPNPTIELRVADSCTRLDDAVAIAALFRCLVRALDRDREINAGFDRRRPCHHPGEQMARPALRDRRDLHRSVLAGAARYPRLARPSACAHCRRRRGARLCQRNQTPRHDRQAAAPAAASRSICLRNRAPPAAKG